jgi:hypothetical protein
LEIRLLDAVLCFHNGNAFRCFVNDHFGHGPRQGN